MMASGSAKDAATQKLVDRLRQRAVEFGNGGTTQELLYEAADALLHAYRPPVSPEQREALVDTLTSPVRAPGSVAASRVFRAETPEDLEDATALADAILARFSFPTLDPEKVAAWLDDDLYGVIDRAMQRSWTDVAEYEYAPSEITSAVRTWMDEQCFRRWVPAEPAVQGDDYEVGYEEGFHHGRSGPRDIAEAALDAARFSLPVLDVEKVAQWLRSHDDYGVYRDGYLDAENIAAALVADLHTLTTDGTPSDTERNES